MIVSRLDYGTMPRAQKTLQGYLKAPCYATRAGIFVYRNNDGSTRKEFRPPEEVFNQDSLNTLQGIPVTNNHPSEMLDANNTANYSKGFTGDLIEKVDNLVGVPVTITDAELIAAVENREKTETSCGYQCELDETPGEWNGEKYDAIQRKIRYNHLAIVSKGRAGSSVGIRLDSGAVQIDDNFQEEFCMTKIRIDEVDFEVSEPVALALTSKFKKDNDNSAEIDGKIAALQAEIDRLKGEKEGMMSQMDECQKKMDEAIKNAEASKMDSAKIHEAAMVRVALIKVAESVVPEVKLDSLSDKEIKMEVIKKKKPDFKFDGLSDAFIDGVFEGMNSVESRTDSLADAINKTKGAAVSNSTEARARAMEQAKNEWKTK